VRVLNGIFWVLRSGAPWRDLPVCYGPRTTCKLMAKPRRTCPEFQRSSCLSGPEKELNAQLDQWAITIRYEDENPDDETQPAVAAPRPPDSCVKSEFRWCDWSADRVRFDSRGAQHVRVRFDAEIGCNGCSLDRKPLPQRKGFALSTASSPKLGCDPRHTAGAIVVFNTSARQAYA
jgi:hypothetical protein